MLLISNIENLGKPIGITGLEEPKTSTKKGFLCNLCLKEISLGVEYIHARSTKRRSYFYHLECAISALTTGAVEVSKKSRDYLLHQRAYFAKREEWIKTLTPKEYEEYLKIKDKRPAHSADRPVAGS